MLTAVQTDCRRVFTLVEALDEHEITRHEFSDALRNFRSEVLQVIATALQINFSNQSERPEQAWAGRMLRRYASTSRVLS